MTGGEIGEIRRGMRWLSGGNVGPPGLVSIHACLYSPAASHEKGVHVILVTSVDTCLIGGFDHFVFLEDGHQLVDW